MKNLFFTILLLLPMLAWGQLEIEDSQAYGTRTISVSGGGQQLTDNTTPPLTGDVEYYLKRLSDIKNPNDFEYWLVLNFNMSNYNGIAEDGRLLLKTKTGDNITLKSISTRSGKKGGKYRYYLPAMYLITKNQINQIIKSGGLSKARVEFISGKVDLNFADNSLYTFLKNANTKIDETLTKKDTFNEDF